MMGETKRLSRYSSRPPGAAPSPVPRREGVGDKNGLPHKTEANQRASALTQRQSAEALFPEGMEKARHELEIRVEERTEELTTANALLKQEIAEWMWRELCISTLSDHYKL